MLLLEILELTMVVTLMLLWFYDEDILFKNLMIDI